MDKHPPFAEPRSTAKPPPEPPHSQDYLRVLGFIKSGADDRTIAIVVASYAEKYAGEMLKAWLPNLDVHLASRLFEPTGPLGSAAARFDLCLASGMMPAETWRDLKRIARIRNSFAHHIEADSFAHSRVRDHVDQLERVPKALLDAVGSSLPHRPHRARFVACGIDILTGLHNATVRMVNHAAERAKGKSGGNGAESQ